MLNRHGHLLLFDNAEQLEVRHVVALENYTVDIYGGGDAIPEGELWIKRNCIRLSNKKAPDMSPTRPIPFYLFSDNCSEKEDFYHALLTYQDRKSMTSSLPEDLLFNTEDMIKLVRQLHTSEESTQTRWLNALLGRLFLAVYKIPEMEELIRMKITKKMSRVPKPTFITSLRLEGIDMGTGAPMLSNPKLKELAIDGSLVVETDIKYTGNFRIVIAAVARIELGTRFKAREVDLVLAAVLKKLEGHLLIRVKPPPSNRFWISFESMPKIDLSIEPVVSTRQITYGVILRAIESRVREVIAETLVLPNWDDTPFTDTTQQLYRGGIWQTNKKSDTTEFLEQVAKDAVTGRTDQEDEAETLGVESDVKTGADISAAKPGPIAPDELESSGSSIATDAKIETQPLPSSPIRSTTTKRPKALRSSSFAAAAVPVISGGSVVSEAVIHHSQTTQQDATSAMKKLSSKSPEASLSSSPLRPPFIETAATKQRESSPSSTSLDAPQRQSVEIPDESNSKSPEESTPPPLLPPRVQPGTADRATIPIPIPIPSKSSSSSSSVNASQEKLGLDSSSQSTSSSTRGTSVEKIDKREVLNQTLNSASSAAKKWGLGVLNNWQESKVYVKAEQHAAASRTEPFGRGQPLPPPGVPLPKPEVATSFFGSVKKKPMSTAAPSPHATSAATLAASKHPRQGSATSIEQADAIKADAEPTAPPLPRRTGSNEGEADRRPPKKERID